MPEQTRKFVVMTISDSCYAGKREDAGGPLLIQQIESLPLVLYEHLVLPDEEQFIAHSLKEYAAVPEVCLIATTGGTGISPRDVTPEATLSVIERPLPGMAEAMRQYSLNQTPFAMLSRQVVGVIRQTLIINFPGSPKAVNECFQVIQPVLLHTIDLIRGKTEHP
ncbi:MogA/MoaB family molybdenum cofactor biosynthesis protein [Alicyclobacillus tolerans]|uniref:Molybdopterin adenylyltransferase n=1 Tax=Alicyclobacillus tolerans TaxID=90970 RepID=A0A1M6M1D3_9BACL|nr:MULTISPECIES: MogA/MoaB family molybdenum cofactor biosynthesis protein [Alicyclobacillus]QRF22609.1 MogA/MoaB family molybdenum cofactor biosynthesis protein [Alicyclobacillus sp. TC]SHJ77277.1 molybdopterin adenylyltransferase [Alicyclobacillus montanus]